MNAQNSLSEIANSNFLLKSLVNCQIIPQNSLSKIANSDFLLKSLVNYQMNPKKYSVKYVTVTV